MADANGTAEEPVGSIVRAGDPAVFERAGAILSELVEATRSAADALLDEQRQRAAAQVKDIGEAVRSAAQALERSQTPTLARYADQAASQIDQFSHLIGDRSWREIVAETQDFARRRPWLFLCAATAAGFLAGRMLSAPTNRRAGERELCSSRETSEEVTAAVASGDGKLVGQHADISTGAETD
jgi:ElaB/YqjD/DUF883 family membrane-anchored ribosome-binding protein